MPHQEHAGGGCGHAGCDHGPAPEDVLGHWTLNAAVDTQGLRALNAAVDDPDVLKLAFRAHSERFDFAGAVPPVRSNEDDAELLLFVPFTTNVSVTSICILGARAGSAPAEVKCFVNRGEDLDFATAAEAPPTQRFELSEALDSRLEYPTEARKWQGVHSVWMYFPRNHAGEDSETGIWYIGFKGLASGVRREVVKNVVYESAPRPQDHSGKAEAEGEKFKNWAAESG